MNFTIGLFKMCFWIASVGLVGFLIIHYGAEYQTHLDAEEAATKKYISDNPEVVFVKVWCTNNKEGRKDIKIACNNPIFRGKPAGYDPLQHWAYFNYCQGIRHKGSWDTATLKLRNWKGECVTFLKGKRIGKYSYFILNSKASTVKPPYTLIEDPLIHYDRKTKQVTLNKTEMHVQSGGWYGRLARTFFLAFASNPYWKAGGISVVICVLGFLAAIGTKSREKSEDEDAIAAWAFTMCVVWFIAAFVFNGRGLEIQKQEAEYAHQKTEIGKIIQRSYFPSVGGWLPIRYEIGEPYTPRRLPGLFEGPKNLLGAIGFTAFLLFFLFFANTVWVWIPDAILGGIHLLAPSRHEYGNKGHRPTPKMSFQELVRSPFAIMGAPFRTLWADAIQRKNETVNNELRARADEMQSDIDHMREERNLAEREEEFLIEQEEKAKATLKAIEEKRKKRRGKKRIG